ncbi:MAG: sigma-70 family RNA polymerase sigma factor [Clostridia bacterium]|nr:sigma-70 family RNA polymerase sigma factor [Clostridia bacterium]
MAAEKAGLPDDRTLIGLYFDRDERAITETKQKYGALIRSIALRLLTNPSDAEECENDAYFRLWNAIPPARPDNFAAYAAKTVRNLALDKLEKDNAAKRGGRQLALELNEALPDSRSDDYALSDLTGAIDAFLRTVEKKERIPFLLRYFHGFSIDEIATKCGCSPGAVKSQLLRTRNILKTYLERGGYAL